MSFRFTPKAQRKNRLVTRAKGIAYRRSVSGTGEWLIGFRLGQSTIEVHVAAIHEQMLAVYVRGASRKQECVHGDLK